MKYCPYCGADLPDGAISFCAEGGKTLPERTEQASAKKAVKSEKKRPLSRRFPAEQKQPQKEKAARRRQTGGAGFAGWHI